MSDRSDSKSPQKLTKGKRNAKGGNGASNSSSSITESLSIELDFEELEKFANRPFSNMQREAILRWAAILVACIRHSKDSPTVTIGGESRDKCRRTSADFFHIAKEACRINCKSA
jgi:hypothetical protein